MLDRELLQKFIEIRSQEAFAEIAGRYMDAVYAAARRQMRNAQQAEDVCQAVFIILARKAHKLQNRDSLAGWMMKTTHLASLDAAKIEARRRRHEQRAASMAPTSMEPDMNPEFDAISPQLDRAMSQLSESDRTAVTLRYLQGNTTTQTANLLQITEQAAAKRISRAIARLRKILLRKNAIASAVSVAVILDQIPRVSAPAALAKTITLAATAGASAPASTAIANGVMHMITWHKIAAAFVLIALLSAVTGIGVKSFRLLADQADATAPPPPPPPPAAAEADRSSGAIARLSNGVSLEILGISENRQGAGPWWQIDGQPLLSDLHADVHTLSVDRGHIARNIVVRVNRTVAGSSEPATVTWYLQRGGVSYSGSSNVPGTEAIGTELPDAPTGSIRAQVAAGAWENLASAEGTGQTAEGGPGGQFLFSAAYQDRGKTNIVVGMMGKFTREDIRLVAVDYSGRERVADSGSMVSNGSGSMSQYSIDLAPELIHQWRLESRPFNQWIEFRGISLHPGQKTNPKISTSDGPHNEQSPGN